MRAPVYRHVDGQSTIAGVSLNGFVVLLGIAYAAIATLGFLSSVLVVLGSYGALRVLGHGKPPAYWQHLAVWHLRRHRTAGRLAAAARAKSPQFPFGPYRSIDVRLDR